ncbi:MAG TPA: ABC transporter permease [Bacteroidales bacterium]|nr:ABC transporter permease [Bacteroidales bacterium]
MRTVLFIVQKEFIQVFRNRMMLPIIFVVPLIQLIILVHAATFEMKHIRMAVVDLDLSSSSRLMTGKFMGSPFFKVNFSSFSYKEAENEMKKGNVDVILSFPYGFEKKLMTEKFSKVQLVINAINGASAGLINAYAMIIILDYNREVLARNLDPSLLANGRNIQVTENYWYNPKLNYKTYMVPGILVLLVTIIGLLLSGMNIVREKEIGTIEQINVTPVKKIQFIAGKLIPFWILALLELVVGLSLGKLLFNIPIVGSLWLIFLSAGVYLLVILGFGLIVSTITQTQQQAMMISFFFLVIFILMSGLFTSIESMPDWAQWLDRFNPIAYFIRIMRMVMLKGSGFRDIRDSFFSLVIYGFCSISVAVWRYRKVA